jgi:hypothetical protein
LDIGGDGQLQPTIPLKLREFLEVFKALRFRHGVDAPTFGTPEAHRIDRSACRSDRNSRTFICFAPTATEWCIRIGPG